MKPNSLLLLLCLSFAASAPAWNDSGHLLIAQIAYERLAPALQQKLSAELGGLSEGAHTYNAVSAACFADDLRRDQHHLDAGWHFIDPPFTSSGKPLPAGQNVVWAIGHCIAVYKGQETDVALSRQQALAMVMHLVGDVHQPLHCTSHADAQGKDDAGGNGVAVTNMPDALYPNLHSFWDSAFQRGFVSVGGATGTVTKLYEVSRPSAPSRPNIEGRAAALVHGFAPGPLGRMGGLNPQKWALESHRLGYQYGYQTLPGGPDAKSVALTAAYVAAANKVASQRIVLAGYRLADVLQSLLTVN